MLFPVYIPTSHGQLKGFLRWEVCVLRALRDFPPLSLSAFHFTSVVSSEKLILIEYWKSEVMAKQSLAFGVGSAGGCAHSQPGKMGS